MNKQIFIKTNNDYVFFTDIDNTERVLAITKDEMNVVAEKMKEFRHLENFPSEETVNAYELTKVGEKDAWTDYYDITDIAPFIFPTNKIKFIWVKLTNE
jgi:hypothetical protein